MRLSRRSVLPILALAAVLAASALSACSPSGGAGAGGKAGAALGGSSGPDAAKPAATEPAKADPYAEITADGPHEQAVRAAVPAMLAEAQNNTKTSGATPTDVSSAKPRLVAYMIRAIVGKRVLLFEVRADGKAYELYKYPAAPDPAKYLWQDAAMDSGAYVVAPSGASEEAAVAAVRAAVEKAAPGETAKIEMRGYTFFWVGSDGQPVISPSSGAYSITINPNSTLASWSN